MKIKVNPFQLIHSGTAYNGNKLVQVWYTQPETKERRFICAIPVELVPELVSILNTALLSTSSTV